LRLFFGRVMLLAMYFICPFAWDNAITNGCQISLTTASCRNRDSQSRVSSTSQHQPEFGAFDLVRGGEDRRGRFREGIIGRGGELLEITFL
jgi:hypothetical protein